MSRPTPSTQEDRARLHRLRARAEDAPPSEGTDIALSLANVLERVLDENAQLRELLAIKRLATPSELAVLQFLAKRVTSMGESGDAMALLREELCEAARRLPASPSSRQLFLKAKAWAEQGPRSRWSTEPSLALYDHIQAMQRPLK